MKPLSPAAHRGWCARAAFTMVELMVVIGIVAMFLGFISFMPREANRSSAVRSAAMELAATIRQARALAMDRRAIYGLSFNIECAPGSSGRILNNFSGQHWYQILGPSIMNFDMNTNGLPMCPYPEAWWYNGVVNNVTAWINEVNKGWSGERHYLPAHQVRFLALADQDVGGMVSSGAWQGQLNTFANTYPRPWYGYWDPAAKRLYPWGGYDTNLVDSNGRKSSAFYYEGNDGTILNCENSASRSTTFGTPVPLYAAGTPRPIINGNWEDVLLLFNPDGTVIESLFYARWQCLNNANGGGGGAGPFGDLGDRSATEQYVYSPSYYPMTNLTGAYVFTLAPDADQDTDQFSTAQAAWNSIMPAFRVSVNSLGLVAVEQVEPSAPAGTVFDTTITNWNDDTQTTVYYKNNRLTNSDGTPRGNPVMDFLTPDMLANRQWWTK